MGIGTQLSRIRIPAKGNVKGRDTSLPGRDVRWVLHFKRTTVSGQISGTQTMGVITYSGAAKFSAARTAPPRSA